MFCKKCGKKIDDDSVFCKFCGERLINENSCISLIIENVVNGQIFNLKITDEKIYKELFATLIKLHILPSNRECVRSAFLYDNKGFVSNSFNTEEINPKYIYDGAKLYLNYEEPLERTRFIDSSRMVYLYGCPNSTKNSKRNV